MTTPVPKFTYRNLERGQRLLTIQHEISRDFHARYCRSTGEEDPFYVTPDENGDLILPPAVASIFSTHVLGQPGVARPSGDIHAQQESEFVRPIRVNDVLTTTGYVVDKYERNERKFLVFDTLSVDAGDKLVLRCRVTISVPE